MFDVFRFAKEVTATKTTRVKVHGATMPLTGLPDAYTVDGLAALALAQEGKLTVTLPRCDATADVQAQTKLQGVSQADAANLVRQQYPGSTEETKVPVSGSRRKTKADKAAEERGGIDPALNGQSTEHASA